MSICLSKKALMLLAVGTLLLGCAKEEGRPNLAITYNASASGAGPDRNPIIVIPGLLGSKLHDRQTNVMVWGAFDSISVDPSEPKGLNLLALPLGDGNQSLAQLRDDIEPSSVLDKAYVTVLGIPIELEVYAGILKTLGSGGYRDRTLGLAGVVDYGPGHFTCFQYPYDWRRDIVESARLLGQFIRQKQAYVRGEYQKRFGIKNANVKFDIATHSMGGLVTRYFLMYGEQDLPADGSLPELTWEGAKYVERVIFIGTPNAGSVLAFENLINGKDLGPFAPIYPAALLGTYPSAFQLIPRARHRAVVWDRDPKRPIRNLLDPALWARLGWGLAGENQTKLLTMMMPDVTDPKERRRRALALQARILRRAKVFQRAMDRPATPPPGLQMFLVAGDGFETPKTASVSSTDGSISIHEFGDGDGTVLRSSALMDERLDGRWQRRVRSPISFHSVLFLPNKHIDLTNGATFTDNLLYWLLQDPRATLPKSSRYSAN